MGVYINPTGESKEQWLEQHGAEMPPVDMKLSSEHLPVCLVDNGLFTAAAVAYNTNEMLEFLRADGRAKRWFLVPLDELLDPDVIGAPDVKFLRDRL